MIWHVTDCISYMTLKWAVLLACSRDESAEVKQLSHGATAMVRQLVSLSTSSQKYFKTTLLRHDFVRRSLYSNDQIIDGIHYTCMRNIAVTHTSRHQQILLSFFPVRIQWHPSLLSKSQGSENWCQTALWLKKNNGYKIPIYRVGTIYP